MIITAISTYKGIQAHRLRPLRFCVVVLYLVLVSLTVSAQNKFEKKPIGKVEIVVGASADRERITEQYRIIALEALGTAYSSGRVRDAIEALYQTKMIDTIVVSAALAADATVDLTFTVKRKTQAQRVDVVVVDQIAGDKITEQELLFKLNLLTPGTPITDVTLRNNADQILEYLRDRGFYRSEVTYERRQLQAENEVGVTFRVTPNEQAKVENFAINIAGYEKQIPPDSLKLKKGANFSRERLNADVARVREILRDDDFLAPQLEEPRIVFDSDNNVILIELAGRIGPKVEVSIDSKKGIRGRTQNRLLPVKREGTLDFSAIVEGERRLENYYQEQGYFFADVTPVCSAEPQLSDTENVPIANESEFLCSFLSGEDLVGRKIDVKYRVELDRYLRLTDIRIQGTDKLSYEDVSTVLGSQMANIFGIIPVLGYGRGYTSTAILAADVETIRSLMIELGYRDARVIANQGVSPDGENLIITFVVEEGIPTVVSDVSITGNKAVQTDTLLAELPLLTGRNYSRARVRNAVRKLSEYYSNQGYYDARVTSSIIESDPPAGAAKEDVKVVFEIANEGKKVVINRILVDGNEDTKTRAILRAVTLKSGELLRSADIYSSEQNLYGSDAFERVEIKPQPAGDGPDGSRLTDVIINVDEQPSRLISYGGGYSTDLGLSGFFDIRHVNLLGNLWQGGARVKVSQRQQLVQFDFINPRFIRDGEKRFAPLTLSVQYQRDSTVTRFFRSTFDKGTFGIVQRVDADGNAIDQFGAETGSPTINRFAVTAETSRTISRKNRSILFLRYRFEDVRLFKIESLLIKDLLRPDERTRISGFTATFVRDTRQNCSVRYSLLDLIAKGEESEPCRYNASDPTRGDYLTADYNVSVPFLGANVGFQKFQASYNYYYTIPALKNTTIAARGIIGVGRLFSSDNRFTSTEFPSLNGLLPISERFFAGGPNNLRGFDFEEAGPRVVIVPQGIFLNSKREPVFLDPFTIPFGGNALAVVNIEARVPLSKTIRAVPFYDGGNVFRKAGDIFKSPAVGPNDVAGQNQRATWKHTVGLGLRIKTPVGGEFGVDYGHLLNPPRFLIPQAAGGNAIYRLRQSQLHFRFSQAF